MFVSSLGAMKLIKRISEIRYNQSKEEVFVSIEPKLFRFCSLTLQISALMILII